MRRVDVFLYNGAMLVKKLYAKTSDNFKKYDGWGSLDRPFVRGGFASSTSVASSSSSSPLFSRLAVEKKMRYKLGLHYCTYWLSQKMH